MAHNDGTSCKFLKTFLQGAQGVDVYIVGRFVEKQYVALLFQSHGQMKAVSFAAGEHSDLLFLISS